MAVAIAALVIAIAGTAVASVGTISVLTKNDKKQIKKIAGKVADQRVRSASSGLVVKSAGSADIAKVADTAIAADSAKVGRLRRRRRQRLESALGDRPRRRHALSR